MNALKELDDLKINWEEISALRINVHGKSIIYTKDVDNDLEKIKDELLKIDYDDDYGCQNLFGLILMCDGSWYERGEYDGAEWWNHKHTPSVDEVINFNYSD